MRTYYLVTKLTTNQPQEEPFQIFDDKEMLKIWWRGVDVDHRRLMAIYRFYNGKNPKRIILDERYMII